MYNCGRIPEKPKKGNSMADDWRLTNQELYLMGKTLYYIRYRNFSEEWDHEHCDFCWAKFSEYDGDLHEGYCTEPENARGACWICPECYNDFKERFKWRLGQSK
jgi:hypothetical protein